jgi:hypothetical protein
MHTSTLLALALAAAVAGTASAQTCGDTTVDCAAEDVNTEEMPADTPCRNCDAAECCAPPTSVGSGPPEGCTSWHDGCNTCQVMSGGATACTEMACARTTPPYCMAYVDGRECTDATTCSPAVDPVDPVDEEQLVVECSEDADCARGLVCQGQWNNALSINENFACVEEGTVGIMTRHDSGLAGEVVYYASTDGTCEGENAEVPLVFSVPPQGPGCHAYGTWEPPLPELWPTTGTYYEVLGCDDEGHAIVGGYICINADCSDCQESYATADGADGLHFNSECYDNLGEGFPDFSGAIPCVEDPEAVAECSEDADCARGLVCQGQWNNALSINENFACVEEGTVGILDHDDEYSHEDGVAEECVGVACERATAGEGGVDCAGVGADTPCDFTALVAATGGHLAGGARGGLVAQYCACQRVLGEHTELVEAGVTASCDGAAGGQPEGAATGGDAPLVGGR